nr:hypothetical protein Iba_chr15eCG7480 [Ipomoea batatas]
MRLRAEELISGLSVKCVSKQRKLIECVFTELINFLAEDPMSSCRRFPSHRLSPRLKAEECLGGNHLHAFVYLSAGRAESHRSLPAVLNGPGFRPLSPVSKPPPRIFNEPVTVFYKLHAVVAVGNCSALLPGQMGVTPGQALATKRQTNQSFESTDCNQLTRRSTQWLSRRHELILHTEPPPTAKADHLSAYQLPDISCFVSVNRALIDAMKLVQSL